MQGKIIALFIAPKAGAPTEPQEAVYAEPGKGLRGDRYYRENGAWSSKLGSGREVTLIESEAIQAAQDELRTDIALGDSRRNIVTEGISLNDLVGKEFVVGRAKLFATRLCHPCNYLGNLTSQAFSDALTNRGGLRCEIVEGGEIRVGDPVVAPKCETD